MDGAKAFLQLSSKRADQWVNGSQFQKVRWLNLPEERAGKMGAGGQVKAGFSKPEAVQRKTSSGPSSERTNAHPEDRWPCPVGGGASATTT